MVRYSPDPGSKPSSLSNLPISVSDLCLSLLALLPKHPQQNELGEHKFVLELGVEYEAEQWMSLERWRDRGFVISFLGPILRLLGALARFSAGERPEKVLGSRGMDRKE